LFDEFSKVAEMHRKKSRGMYCVTWPRFSRKKPSNRFWESAFNSNGRKG
jgi:hypothetical protein